ncbi:MAG: GntG family PLP-dependent aldolase [Methanobacteriota archaeon]
MRPPPGIDLRSDTVTKPTPRMREAMRDAEVGNSAWDEDPTVARLEAQSAAAVGKEAALFVPSGTMGNQVALKVWTARKMNPEVILEARSHIMLNEAAGLAGNSGAQGKPVAGVRGAMPPEAVRAAIQIDYYLKPVTALIAVEETHNYAGGAVLPIENLRAVQEVAREHALPVHMDGARIFNAETALAVDAARIASHADSVQFCFSKGLACPVGSVVCGPREFIAEATRARAVLGGAMRQAGVLAAAALVGLEEMRFRLHADHANAKRLAEGLAKLDGIRVDPSEAETNIVIFDVAPLGVSAQEFAARMRERDVGYSTVGPYEVRAVTHNDVSPADIEDAILRTSEFVEGWSKMNRTKRKA